MELRRNYATSLSSASFILELRFEAEDGKSAAMHLAVSRGICFSEDGDMQGDVIYLYPSQEEDDVVIENRSIYSAATLDDLSDLLFDAATIEGWQDPMAEKYAYRAIVNGLNFAIDGRLKCYSSHKELAGRIEQLGGLVSGSVSSETDYLICNDQNSASRKASKARLLGIPIISDFDFAWGLFGKNLSCDNPEACDDNRISVSVRDVAPVTIRNFKCACAEAGITLSNLKKITIQNNKYGNRDSAMFILSSNDKFAAYRKMYLNAAGEQKKSIAKEFIAFVKAGPILEVNDNAFELPETMCCVWCGSEEALEKEMCAYLECGGSKHWMGTHSQEFTIDFAEKTVTSREVLFFGDI